LPIYATHWAAINTAFYTTLFFTLYTAHDAAFATAHRSAVYTAVLRTYPTYRSAKPAANRSAEQPAVDAALCEALSALGTAVRATFYTTLFAAF
jgi:hypothetical protein